MTRLATRSLRELCLMAGVVIACVAPGSPVRAQTVVPAEEISNKLASVDTTADLNIAELRQRALDRIKSKADAAPLKRPPVAPELLRLPQVTVEVRFDPDSSIIRPNSYQTLGLLADAFLRSTMLSNTFLIVGHTESTGKREFNLTLSQRRADSIRDALVTTFKISPKRIQTLGLGEEQMRDAAQPASATNQRFQIVTIAKAPAP
jgi:outer membrane protein OmpA-like peptidoglycan-associated protein